ncbi:MAG: oligosaccharide flippase family protein [Candidatus Pacearchaeota archaeon]
MNNFLKERRGDFRKVLRRIFRRDFSGNAGIAIKNSTYQLGSNMVVKIGSLIFTIILARLLLPEKFGLYSLALSTIILFSAFADFGIASAIVTFIPKELKKKNFKKAKGYFLIFLKWKIYLLIIVSLAMVVFGYFISNNYYQKPIYLALIAGIFYIFFSGLLGFLELFLKANGNFKASFFKELIFQISRIILIALTFVIIFKNSSDSVLTAGVIFVLSVCFLLASIYLFMKINKINYLKYKKQSLNKKEYKSLIKFILPLFAIVLSGVFFGYIDTIMLGGNVSAQFLSYYSIAFSLIGSIVAVLGFSASSLHPLFSVTKGKALEHLFRKAKAITIMFSFSGAVATLFLAEIIIKIAYGSAYLPSAPILKLFSVLVFLLPISALYDAYFLSQKKTRSLAIILIFATILNIVLNYFGIKYGIKYGEFGAIVGVSIASIFSKTTHLGGLILFKKISKNIK